MFEKIEQARKADPKRFALCRISLRYDELKKRIETRRKIESGAVTSGKKITVTDEEIKLLMSDLRAFIADMVARYGLKQIDIDAYNAIHPLKIRIA